MLRTNVLSLVVFSLACGAFASPASNASPTLTLSGLVLGAPNESGKMEMAFNFFDPETRSLVHRTVAVVSYLNGGYVATVATGELQPGASYIVTASAPGSPPQSADAAPNSYVRLQALTPGAQQTGHVNISGTLLAGQVGIGVASPLYPLHVETAVGQAIRGESSATNGVGVYGRANSFSGAAYGVYGHTNSSGGAGVFGIAANSSGTNYGVYGHTSSGSGYGGYFIGRGYFSGRVGIGTLTPTRELTVVGGAEFSDGISAEENNGIAIAGFSTGGLLAYGVYGESNVAGGRGVYGLSSANTGAGAGVRGQSNSPAGWGGYFVGRGYFSDFLGVGRETSVTSAEVFGINSTTTNSFGGMYVRTDGAAGKPFYGYSAGGGADAFHYYDGAVNKWILRVSGVDRITVDGATGNVGIGTGSPTQKLTVAGNVEVTGGVITDFGLQVNNGGASFRDGSNETIGISAFSGDIILGGPGEAGALLVRDSGDVTQVLLDIDGNGDGRVIADVKNFKTQHPFDSSLDIWYCCIEGPEAAMYVRGTARLVDGHAVIELPEHFRALAVEKGMTIQLTPLSSSSLGLAVVSKSLNGIAVVELHKGRGNYEFDWEVKAVRKGYEEYQVIRPRIEDPTKARNREQQPPPPKSNPS